MPLIYCGIDEAGYGPLLGPLCVGLSVLRVEAWREGDPAPDLWDLLKRAVCREPGDKQGRIAVDDSKKLKLANSSVRRHPVYHLERAVLAFLASAEPPLEPSVPLDDLAMLAALGARCPCEEWYAPPPGGAGHPVPVGLTAPEISIAANQLRVALGGAGVSVLRLGCECIGETDFNEVVSAAGTKAAATEAALARHLWHVWDAHGWVGAAGGGGVRVVCDRQGGRTQYADVLSRVFPGATVATVAEAGEQSKYDVAGVGEDGRARRMGVLFMTESESAHLPVALASLVAKLTRETLMARFNRYWCARMPELKPTAGYRNDAWRWLQDAQTVLTPELRAALMRKA